MMKPSLYKEDVFDFLDIISLYEALMFLCLLIQHNFLQLSLLGY